MVHGCIHVQATAEASLRQALAAQSAEADALRQRVAALSEALEAKTVAAKIMLKRQKQVRERAGGTMGCLKTSGDFNWLENIAAGSAVGNFHARMLSPAVISASILTNSRRFSGYSPPPRMSRCRSTMLGPRRLPTRRWPCKSSSSS